MHRSICAIALLICALHLRGTSRLVAQGDRVRAPGTFVWATVGGGFSSMDLGGVLGLDVLHGHHLISVRAAGVAGVLADEFWDAALLYGRARRWRRSMASISSGVAMVKGLRCPSLLSACDRVPSRASLPIAARMSWQALPFLGVGLYGFANINGEESFTGVVFALEVGHIR